MLFFLPEIRVMIVRDHGYARKSWGQFVHPLLPPPRQCTPCFSPARIPRSRGSARRPPSLAPVPPAARGQRGVRAGDARRASTRRGRLGRAALRRGSQQTARARRGESAQPSEKLLPRESFTLRGPGRGRGREETRPPRGQARRAGGRKGGGRFPPRGGAGPHLSGPWTRGPSRRADGRCAGQTDTCCGGRAARWGAWPCLQPGRARARADARLSHGPGSSRVGRGGGSGRRADGALGWARRQVTRRFSPTAAPRALCEQMRSPAQGASQMRGDS